MPRIFINLEAGCLQANLMSTSTQINQLRYTILYYTILYYLWMEEKDLRNCNPKWQRTRQRCTSREPEEASDKDWQ